MDKNKDLLTIAAEAEPIAARLRQMRAGQWPVPFSHVVDSAQPFLVAALARAPGQANVGPLSERSRAGIVLRDTC